MILDVAARRERGSGGIDWLKERPGWVRLRVWQEAESGRVRRSKLVKVRLKNHGGRGDAAEALEQFAAELDAEAKAAAVVSHTLPELMESYIAHCARRGRSKGTLESYALTAKRLRGEIATKDLAELTSDDLDGFYSELEEKLAVNTVRQTHAVITAALNYAVKSRRWIVTNPAANATPPEEDEDEAEPLAPADIDRMILAALELGDAVLAMGIFLAAILGARRGELVALKWSDLDTQTGRLKIQRQWVPRVGGQFLETPKSKKGIRTVHLGPRALLVLERYRVTMGRLLEREPEGWILSHDAGTTHMRPQTLADGIAKVGRSLDLTVTTHRFRKVQATELAAAGVDVDTAARRMGHTKEIMFGHYMLGSEDKAIEAGTTIEVRLVDRGMGVDGYFDSPPELTPPPHD